MSSSSSTNVVSWNVNSLNGPVKHAVCLDYLHRHQVDVAFVQESHNVCRFDKFYCTAASASVDFKTRVVFKWNLSLIILGNYGSTDEYISYIKTNHFWTKICFYFYICTQSI